MTIILVSFRYFSVFTWNVIPRKIQSISVFFEWLDVSYHESYEKKYEGAEVYNYIFIYEDIRLSTSSDILLFKEEEINYIMMMHLMKTEKGYILKS